MDGEVGKETPKKELDNPSFYTYFYDVTQATFQRFIELWGHGPLFAVVAASNKVQREITVYKRLKTNAF